MIAKTKHFLSSFWGKDKAFVQALASILGFYPGNVPLYKQAFRHRSQAVSLHNKAKSSNERLEYLGDAVLGAVVAELLFKKFPYKEEGFLTETRSKIVNRESLGKLALKMGIAQLIEHDPRWVTRSINGDAFEALIGAVYLDKGYAKTRSFILNRIIKIHIDLDELVSTEVNFKSKLIEWGQRERKSVQFEVVEELGNGRKKQIKVLAMVSGEPLGEGVDFAKKKAEQIAAKKACETLEI